MRPNLRLSVALAGIALTLAACGILGPATPTLTPVPPTATPQPRAALVHAEPILLADYLAEVERFEDAHRTLGTDLATLADYRGQILQGLIDQKLLAQGARSSGLSVAESEIDARLEELAAEAGGNEALGAWLAANGYTLEGFRSAVAEEMLAQKMIEEIAAQVGDAADQVHARHLLVSTREQADDLRSQIAAGEGFALLARQFTLDLTTRPAGGDLGWFPRGVLLAPEVEQAAFALEPGEVSPAVESRFGFHLVETVERGVRPLSPDAAVRLRELAVEAWLAAQRDSAAIEIYVTP